MVKKYFKGCNKCGFNNPKDANVCNACSNNFQSEKAFSKKWLCSCGAINQEQNDACHGTNCGFVRNAGGCFRGIMEGMIIVVIISLIGKACGG
jgi:hypothetical protein